MTTAKKVPGLLHISEASAQAIDHIEGRASGRIKSLRTRYKCINNATIAGFEWGDIITIAGMSSSGKTLIASELEDSLIDLNPHEDFIIFSNNFEMQAKRLLVRKASAKFKESYRNILSADAPLNPEMIHAIREYFRDELAARNIYYSDKPLTVDEYEEYMYLLYRTFKKPILSVNDHAILFKRTTELDNTKLVYNLCERENIIKREIPCIQINLSQLNRDIESTDRRKVAIGHYPIKADIMSADSLFHVSDLLMVNHKPKLLNLLQYGPEGLPCGDKDIYWHFLKARNGETGMKRMVADFKNMTILEP